MPSGKKPKFKLLKHPSLDESNISCEHDIIIEKMSNLYDEVLLYADPEGDSFHFLLHEVSMHLLKAKLLYLAWKDEEY